MKPGIVYWLVAGVAVVFSMVISYAAARLGFEPQARLWCHFAQLCGKGH